jgi:hypothetical protein
VSERRISYVTAFIWRDAGPIEHTGLRPIAPPLQSMPVTVVGVGHVRVIMNERKVAMGVRMRLSRRIFRAVLVLVVRVMNV